MGNCGKAKFMGGIEGNLLLTSYTPNRQSSANTTVGTYIQERQIADLAFT